MKKKLITIVSIVALICILSVSLVACSTPIELFSYAANSDVFINARQHIFTGSNNNNVEENNMEENINPDLFFTGTGFKKFSSFQIWFNLKKVAGQEFAVVQFEIEADRDVNGVFEFRYYPWPPKAIDCGKVEYVLKANEPQTITFNFINNFIPNAASEEGSFYVDFNIGHEHYNTAIMKKFIDTEYKISKFELALNKNK